ncbi:MAG: MerR family transcriptional regulator [Bacteroidetes bacterium]|nr:MerR family transcriptional regulator [Bacteroidota bacterium]
MSTPEHIEKIHFTIGEVAAQLQVAPSLIRFWEKEFPQLKPQKTEGGTRKFTQKDIQVLKRIYHLVKEEGFTLQGAKERLKEGNQKADLQEIKERLTDIKKFLENIKNQLSV